MSAPKGIEPINCNFLIYLRENFDRKFKDKPNCNEEHTKNINTKDKKKNLESFHNFYDNILFK